jgi:integrase
MEYFEEFIKRTKDGVRTNGSITKFSKNTIKNYSMTESLLKDFAKDELYKLDFDSINMNFYELLMAFMNKRKYKINTKGKHIATIKNLMNDATDRGYNTNLIFRSKNFKRLSEEVFNIYLTKDEINDIANLDLSNNSRRDIIRDLFLIGCYTGQSYIDYSNFNKNNIHGDFIKYSRAKNPNVSFKNEINIPIKHELLKILEKYDYKLPKTFSNQKTNKHLKEIGKMVDSLNVLIEINLDGKKTYKYNCIGTHTARRSFASNEYIDGTPSLSIMQLTGHKTEKSFMKYIKLSSKEHAQIIKKTWDERSQNKLKVII